MAVFGTKDRLKLKLINYVMIKNTFRCLLLGIVIIIINLIFINIVRHETFKTMSVVHPNLKINSPDDKIVNNVRRNEGDKSNSGKETIPFVISLCYKVPKYSQDFSLHQVNFHFREFCVLLKSMVLSAKKLIRVIILSDKKSAKEYIQIYISKWPSYYRNKLIIEYQTFKERPECMDPTLFKPCASVRLYYHEILPQEEAVVHIDSDIIFLRSPEDILTHFKNFGGEHLIGSAPDAGFYGRNNPSNDYPYYGNSGLNSGFILMNLTRIRDFSLNFTQTVEAVCASFKGRLHLYDQGVLNLIFSEYPEAIYDLDCRWNFMPNECPLKEICPEAINEDGEIFAIHGVGKLFYNSTTKSFRKIFRAFEDFDLNGDPSKLGETLSEGLNVVEEITPDNGDICRFISRIGRALLSHVHFRNLTDPQNSKI